MGVLSLSSALCCRWARRSVPRLLPVVFASVRSALPAEFPVRRRSAFSPVVLFSPRRKFRRTANESFSPRSSDDTALVVEFAGTNIERTLLPNSRSAANTNPNGTKTCTNGRRRAEETNFEVRGEKNISFLRTFFAHDFPHDFIFSFSSSVAELNL